MQIKQLPEWGLTDRILKVLNKAAGWDMITFEDEEEPAPAVERESQDQPEPDNQ